MFSGAIFKNSLCFKYERNSLEMYENFGNLHKSAAHVAVMHCESASNPNFQSSIQPRPLYYLKGVHQNFCLLEAFLRLRGTMI